MEIVGTITDPDAVAALRAEMARRLANELIEAGFTIRDDGPHLWVTPTARLTNAQAEAIRNLKPELLRLLATCCSKCRRPLDTRRACWHCFTRPCCVCGKDTGSCFIAHCIRCGFELRD